MSDHAAEIAQLRDEICRLPDGAAKVALLARAIEVADAANDLDAAFDLRLDHANAAIEVGQPDGLLVSFAWCLGTFDRHPGRFDSYRMHWQYKWAISAMDDFAEIPRERAVAALADLKRRFLAQGANHAYQGVRLSMALSYGMTAEANRAVAALAKLQPGYLSDCPACSAYRIVRYHKFRGDDTAAVAAGEALLAGRLSCAHQPQTAQSGLILPLLRLGDRDRARRMHGQSLPVLLRETDSHSTISYHIEYLTLVGETTKARRLWERYLPDAVASVRAETRSSYYQDGRLLLERLRRSGQQTITLRLPEPMPRPDTRGRYEIEPLLAWLTDEALAVARRFDARDGGKERERGLAKQFEKFRYAEGMA